MIPGHDLYKPRTHLSISALVNVARCPRRYFYSQLGLEPLEDRPALLYGEAIHYAVGRWWDTQSIAAATMAFHEVWSSALDDDKRNGQRAAMSLIDFALAHEPGRSLYNPIKPPPTQIDLGLRVSPYEWFVVLDIGLPIPLVAKLDAVGRHRDSDELWVVEYKTTKEKGSRFLQSFQLNPQGTGYPAILTKLMNEPVTGTMFESIYVSKTTAETLLQPIYVEPWWHDIFFQWARYWGEIILACESVGEFPQWPTGCNSYATFGQVGYNCDYLRLCSVEDWTKMAGTYRQTTRKGFELPVIS